MKKNKQKDHYDLFRRFRKGFLIMRLILIFAILGILQSTASVYSQNQRFTLNKENIILREVFELIEKQSEFRFFYEEDKLNLDEKVNLNVENKTIVEVLNQVLDTEMVEFKLMTNNFIVLKPKGESNFIDSVSSTQQKSLTGKVTDESGEPLPGVTVLIKGTTNGTVTNMDGEFSIVNTNEETVLVFSFVGMLRQEIIVGGQTVIDVNMVTDAIGLEEVIAIGYGVVRKSDLTGAVAKVKADVIASSATSRIDQALQGKAAGVHVTSVNGSPGAGASIRIRGGNSINASNEPLYVIDGFIGGGDLNSINTNDIESIEILKDAAATSIYGARGANGVILITTKRGKEGKTSISVNSYYGIQMLPKKIDLLDGPDRAAYATEHQIHNGQAVAFPDPASIPHTDWQDEMTQNAAITSTNISFSGGNKSVKYFMSGNYFNQEGIILNSGFERFQTRLNIDAELTNWLTTGATMNISRTDRNNNKVSFYDLLKSASTTTPVYNEDGSYNETDQLESSYFSNPKATTDMVIDNTYNTRFLGNYYLSGNFKNGLSFKSTFGFDMNYSKRNQYTPAELPRRLDQDLGGYAKVSTSLSTGILNENTINYIKDFGDNKISLLGGATYQHSQYESLWASGDGFTNDVLEYNKLSTGDPELRQSDTGFNDWTIVSFIARANYNYKDKYLLTLVSRYDGSSRLAANHKWAFFPSAAVAWRLGEEDFIKDLGIFNNLKLRASYGKTGSQAIDIYSTLPTLQVSKIFFNNSEWVSYRTGNLANPDLKWETTDQFDVGLEGGFFNGKLSFELDYYYKRTHDLLLSVEVPRQTGYSSRLENIGEVENQGLEFMVNAMPVKTNDFSWDVSFNISTNKNKVLDLGGKDFIDVAKGARLIVGEPASVFYGLEYDGTWHTQEEIDASNGFMPGVKPGYAKFKDLDDSGKFEKTSDRKILGSPQPDFFGGIQNTLKYKNFELDFYFQGSYGNEIYNEFAPRLFYGGFGSNIHAKALDRWTEQNYMSDIPRAGSVVKIDVNSTVHSTDVQDGSFLRLQTLRFAYNIPTQNIVWLKKAQVYFTGSNLFVFDKYDWGFDPEVNSKGTNSILRGFDGYTYPNNRSFIVGINVNF